MMRKNLLCNSVPPTKFLGGATLHVTKLESLSFLSLLLMISTFVLICCRKNFILDSQCDSNACDTHACLPEMNKYTADSNKWIWSTFVSVSLCTPGCDVLYIVHLISLCIPYEIADIISALNFICWGCSHPAPAKEDWAVTCNRARNIFV